MKVEDVLTLGPEFPLEIERLVQTHRLSYMEAIIHWCEVNGKEESAAAELVKKSPAIMSKLQAEAEDSFMLKRSGARLPI